MNEQPLRTLGDASRREEPAVRPDPAPDELRAKALELLQAEFAKAIELKQRLAAEAADPEAVATKGRAIISSLEGASRLALKLGLIDVAANRDLFAKAQHDGLYEGWR